MSALSPLHRQKRRPYEVNAKSPDAAAICDGCGFLVNHGHLREKKEYRGGTTPVGIGLYVCASCDDVPNPYFSKLVLAPDPVPVDNPRSPAADSVGNSGYGYLVTENGEYFCTDAGLNWDVYYIATLSGAV